jgi:hypothetical protein
MLHIRILFCQARTRVRPWIPSGNDRIDLRAESRALRVRAGSAVGPDWGFYKSKGAVLDKTEEALSKKATVLRSFAQTLNSRKARKLEWPAVVFARRSKPTPGSVAGSGEDAKRISEEELVNIYGKPNEVSIYTGEIIKVRGEYIGYDVNSFHWVFWGDHLLA